MRIILDTTEAFSQYRDNLLYFINELEYACLQQGFEITEDQLNRVVFALKIVLDYTGYIDIDLNKTGEDFGLPCYIPKRLIDELSKIEFHQADHFNELLYHCVEQFSYSDCVEFNFAPNRLILTEPEGINHD